MISSGSMNFASALQSKVFKEVGAVADALQLETYVVGGYVRDLILNRTSTDIDFVCVGSGILLAQKVAKSLGPGVNVSIFKSFGTAQIVYQDLELEFVGARKESYRNDSRKPVVEDGTLEDDQKAGTSTINALAISLNKDTYGDLIDPFDGREDMKKKIIGRRLIL